MIKKLSLAAVCSRCLAVSTFGYRINYEIRLQHCCMYRVAKK